MDNVTKQGINIFIYTGEFLGSHFDKEEENAFLSLFHLYVLQCVSWLRMI